MSHPYPRYEPSGAFSPLTLVFALGALLGAVGLGVLYGLLLQLLAFEAPKVNVLLTAFFALVLGLMVVRVLSWGHCRHRELGLGIGMLVGAAGLVASYVAGYGVALRELAGESDISVWAAARELDFDQWLDLRVAHGWPVFASVAITDVGVVLVWFVEALIIIGVPLWASGMGFEWPYCEPCRMRTLQQSAALPGLTREDAEPLVDTGALAELFDLESPPNADPTLRLELHRYFCPRCTATTYVSVDAVRIETFEDGKHRVHHELLLDKAVLSAALSDQYVARFHG